VRVSVGNGIVGDGGGVAVAFFRDVKPGNEQAVLRWLKTRRVMRSQEQKRFFMPGTITQEEGGVK
jgi:hypothetical protein